MTFLHLDIYGSPPPHPKKCQKSIQIDSDIHAFMHSPTRHQISQEDTEHSIHICRQSTLKDPVGQCLGPNIINRPAVGESRHSRHSLFRRSITEMPKLGPREGNPIYMKNKISKLQVNIFKWINCSECEYHTQTSKLVFLGHGNYVTVVFETIRNQWN